MSLLWITVYSRLTVYGVASHTSQSPLIMVADPHGRSVAFARFLDDQSKNPCFLDARGHRKSSSDPSWVMDYDQPVLCHRVVSWL